MEFSKLVLALIAGLLTTLSPCVLPVLPFVTASSFNANKWGPVLLAFGLLLTFVTTTLLISISGSLFGMNQDSLRIFAGVLLALSGLLFLFPILSDKMATFIGRFTNSLHSNSPESLKPNSLSREFINGLFLGLAWAPCSGPSLGAAIGLASQAGGFLSALVILSVFGIGAIIPLLVFAYSAKSFTAKMKVQSEKIGKAKKIVGILMILIGASIATNFDHVLEAKITALLPSSWVELTSKY